MTRVCASRIKCALVAMVCACLRACGALLRTGRKKKGFPTHKEEAAHACEGARVFFSYQALWAVLAGRGRA